MPYVAIVTVVALLQFIWFGWQVGVARGKYNIPAPAVSGNEMFERVFRVHANTLETLVVFLPALYAAWFRIKPTADDVHESSYAMQELEVPPADLSPAAA